MILLLGEAALAALYDVTFCAQLNVGYTDAPGDGVVGDDYLEDDAIHQPARGAQVVVSCDDCVPGTPNFPVISQYLPWDIGNVSTSTSACGTPMELNSNFHYTIKLKARAEVNGNTIEVYSNPVTRAIWTRTDETGWTPPSDNYTHTIVTNEHEAWDVLAAAGWALKRRNGGITGELFPFNTASTECEAVFSDNIIHMDCFDDKYGVVHEMGHWLTSLAEGSAPTVNHTVATGDCKTNDNGSTDLHDPNSKEHQSAAVNEGFAHYFSAVAFNSTDDVDCWFKTYESVDWNLDGLTDDREVSCEGEPPQSTQTGDWIGEYSAECLVDAPVNHVATPYDWMKTIWDLDTNGAYTVADFLDLWVEAGPTGWDTAGGCATISPLTSVTCGLAANACVYDRLRCGALLVEGGTPTLFDSWTATNGTDR